MIRKSFFLVGSFAVLLGHTWGVEDGHVLLGELKCAACHKAEPGVLVDRKGVDLYSVGNRLKPSWMKRFLADPQKVKPGTPMPDVLAGVPEGERAGKVEALVHYLASLGGELVVNPPAKPYPKKGNQPIPERDPHGARFPMFVKAGEALFKTVGCVACHEPGLDVSDKWVLPKLTEFLLDPEKMRPSGRMPSLHLDEVEAKAIAAYLTRSQPAEGTSAKGLHYSVAFGSWETLPVDEGDIRFSYAGEIGKMEVNSDSLLPESRRSMFPSQISYMGGFLELEEPGVYVFRIRDVREIRGKVAGIELSLKETKIPLAEGKHKLEVLTLSKGKRARLEWRPEDGGKWQTVEVGNLSRTYDVPVLAKEDVDFEPLRDKVEKGKALFAELNCSACHNVDPPMPTESPVAGYERMQPEEVEGIAEKDSKWNGRETPEKAFDGNKGTKYLNQSPSPSGVVMRFEKPVALNGWYFVSANDHPGRDPMEFVLEGSDDGALYDEVATGGIGKFEKRHESQVILFNNKQAYSVYRLTFPKTKDPRQSVGTQLSEIAPLAKSVAGMHTSGVKGIPSLAQLTFDSTGGCIGERPKKGQPHYKLAEEQRRAIRSSYSTLKKPVGEAKVQRLLGAYNCYACHERGGIGGPGEDKLEHFTTLVQVDLGDEGRLPPSLDLAGAKFSKAGLHRVLVDGDRVRPHMATRMPKFGGVGLRELAQTLQEVDGKEIPQRKAETSGTLAVVGRKLVGMTGLACVNCHSWGESKSLGVPGVNLTSVPWRLNPGWFNAWLSNPHKLRPGTRMPMLWPEGKSAYPDLLGGDPDKQMDAIWAYLSAGTELPAPVGLKDNVFGNMLAVTDEPVTFRTFLSGVGAHAIAVGYPGEVNVAFDANGIRLATAWVGPFLSTKEAWDGRAGRYAKIPAKDRVQFPGGPAFAHLDSETSPWPEDPTHSLAAGRPATRTPEGWRFRGYRYDAKRVPTFLYELGEGIKVEETAIGLPVAGLQSRVDRKLVVSGDKMTGWYLRLATGKGIEKKGDAFVVDDHFKHTVKSQSEAFVREIDGKPELLVPLNKTIVHSVTW